MMDHRTGAGLAIAAACLAFALGAASAEAPVALKAQPAVGKRTDALPRLVGTSAPIKKINTALARGDVRLRKAVADCRDGAKSMEATGWSWEREVTAPMRGPAFVSLVAIDGYDCGGAHPDGSTLALTYDLSTGGPIDWSHYLPANLAADQGRSNASDGTVVGVVTSSALIAWYRTAAIGALDGELKTDCKDVLDTNVSGLILWVDAKRGGVAMSAADLPHVVAACAVDVVMPLAELRKRGASPKLIDAIDTAHRARAWTDSF